MLYLFDYQLQKMKKIFYIDRQSGQKQVEKVYQDQLLQKLYGDLKKSYWLRLVLLPLITKFSFLSRIYGYLQKKPLSRRKINPFIQAFEIDSQEFLEPISAFQSFNDFFIRRLKKEARPIAEGKEVAVMPADGRYLFYNSLQKDHSLPLKGIIFNLKDLLQDKELAEKYVEGTLILARLCPSDYHRFHFPFDCQAGVTKLINGYLQSVNPLAVRHNLKTFAQNKRTLCKLQSEPFGEVLYMEIGAFNVGSIQQTYQPGQFQTKGEEKGYFEFGGSALILIFQKNKIQLDADLLKATAQGLEIRCLLGQKLGRAIK